MPPPTSASGARALPWTAVILVLITAVPWLGCAEDTTATDQRRPGQLTATVAYAVDGDTLRVELSDGRLEYVRLVGIDTPEESDRECGAPEASASLEQLAPEGAVVVLRADRVADARDRYGRLLAHAFVDGRQLEVAQLRRGWAGVFRFEGQRFDGLARFDRAEAGARRAGRGAWSLCRGDFHSAR